MVSQSGYVNQVCPVCRSAQLNLFCLNGSHPMKLCTECGFVFAETIPSARELHRTHMIRRDPIAVSNRRRWSQRAGYVCDRTLIKSLLLRNRTIRLLHVGCGDGLLLNMLERHSRFDAMGIDQDPRTIESGREQLLDVYCSTLPEMKLKEQIFDFVHATDLPECLHNPEQMLLELHRVLTCNGYLFVSLPRMPNIQRALRGKDWDEDAGEQLWHFTTKNATLFLDRLGFRISHLRKTWDGSRIWAIVQKQPYLDWHDIPRWVGPPEVDPEPQMIEFRRAA